MRPTEEHSVEASRVGDKFFLELVGNLRLYQS